MESVYWAVRTESLYKTLVFISTPEDGTDMLSQNDGKKLPLFDA
jgi:hypothetical protein